MIRKIFYLGFFVFVACSSGSKEYQKAREFIDAYYVMADHQKALELSEGVAKTLLKKEINLLEGVNERQSAYKTRDIEFEKAKEMISGDDVIFLFELTLHFPNLAPQKRRITINVDSKTLKIKFFGDVT